MIFDNKTTTRHAGHDPASSFGFGDWILAFARMTEVGHPAGAKMGSFCVFSYPLNRIGGDYEAGLRRSARRGGSSLGDLTIWRVRRRTHPTWLIQEPVGVGKLSVQAHFVLHEAPVG